MTEKLGAGYGEIQVLWDVDLEINEGEMVAIVGSNGAGKSTLLGALSGLVEIKSGRVVFEGEDVTNNSSEDLVGRGIVLVPQGRHVFQGLTVKENIMLGAYSRGGGDEARENLKRMFSLFPRLEERQNNLAGDLSGGEQQMCAVARGLMARPRLLMLDELSLGLAPVIVDSLMDTLRQIHEEGTTLLLVEQDVQVALEHAQRGYVLETGRVTLGGPTKELLENPEVQSAYLGL
jgi:branched-chain amino acid transport system ATP-binding protein